MDYLKLATELVEIQMYLLQVPAKQELSKLSKGEIYILYHLVYFGDNIHPRALSKCMAVSSARIAVLLNKLEQKKQIRRLPDQNDNRQVIVSITELGRQRVEQSLAKSLPRIGGLLETLGPEDAEAYIRIQRKILRRFLEAQTTE